MKAMILAAGRGERLRPLTESMPKPMIPISSEPIIVHQIRWLHRAGINEIVVNLHHLGEQIEQRLGSGGDLGVRITYTHEQTLLDTGGGIVNALPHLGNDPFVVLNGDIWTNYAFKRLIGIEPELAHLVLTATPPSRDHGDFYLDGDYVRRGDDQTNSHVFCGIAVLSARSFENAPAGPFSMATDFYFPNSAHDKVTGEVFEGTWFDIGSHEQLKAVRRLHL